MSAEQVKGLGAELAELRINLHEPSVIVVLGKPGVGKTAIANEIAGRLGTLSLNSDEFRRKRFFNNQYEDWHSSVAMWDLILKAGKLFETDKPSIVLDATFSKEKYRKNARKLAEKYGKRIIWVEVVSNQLESKSENIDGQWVTRNEDMLTDIGQRIVVDNSVRSKNKEEQIKRLVDQFVVS